MNYYYTSKGERISKPIIDRKITEAKREKIAQILDEHDYIFCEECGRNATTGVPLDCSHTISVDEAQKTGRTELSWHIPNIKIRCRICHQKHDNTYLETFKTPSNEKSRERVHTGTNRIQIAGKFRIA